MKKQLFLIIFIGLVLSNFVFAQEVINYTYFPNSEGIVKRISKFFHH